MTTAIEPTGAVTPATVSATPTEQQPAQPDHPVNYLQHYRGMLLRAAQGEALDQKTLREILWELGIEKKRHERLLTLATERFRTVARAAQRKKASAAYFKLQSKEEQIEKACHAEREKLQEQITKVRQPLFDFQHEHHAEMRSLNEASSGENEDKAFLNKTADPNIQYRIAQLNHRLLELGGEAKDCRKALAVRTIYPKVDVSASGGPSYVGGQKPYGIDCDHWRRQADGARATAADPDTVAPQLEKARRMLAESEHELKKIDEAKARMSGIQSESNAIGMEIARLCEMQNDWRAFAITL